MIPCGGSSVAPTLSFRFGSALFYDIPLENSTFLLVFSLKKHPKSNGFQVFIGINKFSRIHCASFYRFPPSVRSSSPGQKKRPPHQRYGGLVSALPIFPVSHPTSIFGGSELNFCVRDGNRWTLAPISTDYCDPDWNREKNRGLLQGLLVGVTYFPSQSPDKYRPRR